jgi:aerobic C4-dicarboxylate transport protein
LLFGAVLATAGEKGKVVTNFIDGLSHVLFGIVRIITKLAPIGAFGAMAFTIGKYGIGSLLPMLKLVGTFYLTSIVFVVVVLGIIARAVGFNILRFVAYIKEEMLIVLGTSSSEAALPQLMLKLEKLGCSRSVVGLVVPTGYSFNLDGTNIYMTMAVLFIAQATNTDLTWTQQLTLLAVTMLTSKGASGVTDAGCGADHSAVGHGADPRYRPFHERMPRADEHRRQRCGDSGGVGMGKGTGPQQAECRVAG